MSVLQKLSNRFPTNVTIPTNKAEVAVEALKQIRRLTLPPSKTGNTPVIPRSGYSNRQRNAEKLPEKKSFNSFVAEVKSRGVAKQSDYLVEIMPPPFLVPEPATANLIRLFCEQFTFPEFALATQTIKDYGLNREAVYDKMYGQVNATFLCDQDMIIKDFFDTWALGTVGNNNGVFQYPNRYISHQIRIHQLNAAKQIVYTVTLNRVMLKIINDIVLSHTSRDANRFQVMFTYESWNSMRVPAGSEISLNNSVDIGQKTIPDTRNTGSVIVIPKLPIITDPTKLNDWYDYAGWSNEIKTIQQTPTTVSGAVNGVIDSVLGTITNVGNAVNNTIGGTINAIGGTVVGGSVNGVIQGVTGAITAVGNIFSGN